MTDQWSALSVTGTSALP